MSPLAAAIARRISAEGPIPVAEFMALALCDPEHGYYRRRPAIGAAGDFVTAPEISQMFGEVVGLWCAVVWEAIGRPDPVVLIELGPGHGTLLVDAVRAVFRALPEFAAALRVHLVEISPVLEKRQRRALAAAHPGLAPTWHADLASVPPAPSLIVANEFFDALPVHQYQRVGGAWHERCVDVAAGGGFRLATRPLPTIPAEIPAALADVPDGLIVEVSRAAREAAGAVAARLTGDGGAALIFDYGYAGPAAGETLQAVRRHAFADVLERPGEVDLSAHVDFTALAAAAAVAGARVFGPVEQGVFLGRLGIARRADRLMADLPPHGCMAVSLALRRLVSPLEMGVQFKALAFAHPALTGLPGFAEEPPA